MGTIDMTIADNRQMFHLLQCRSALKIEITTGMKMSRGSVLALCNRLGYSEKRTKRGAYADLNAKIVALGGQDRPLPE